MAKFVPKSKPYVQSGERFVNAVEDPKMRLILCTEGLEKEGKTHFALSAPDPIIIHNFDVGLEGMVHKFKGKDIKKRNYKVPRFPRGSNVDVVSEATKVIWEDFQESYYESLKIARTVIVDTGGEAWETLRLAEFGKMDQVKPHHYSRVNQPMRDLVRTAFDYDSNVIWNHKLKDEYIDDTRTGRFERAGFKDMGFLTQADIRLYKEDGQFKILVNSCRQNPELEGMELPNDGFAAFAMMVYPDSEEGDWK